MLLTSKSLFIQMATVLHPCSNQSTKSKLLLLTLYFTLQCYIGHVGQSAPHMLALTV